MSIENLAKALGLDNVAKKAFKSNNKSFFKKNGDEIKDVLTDIFKETTNKPVSKMINCIKNGELPADEFIEDFVENAFNNDDFQELTTDYLIGFKNKLGNELFD